MTTDYVQQNVTKTLVAHSHLSNAETVSHPSFKGFELTREEDFINFEKDMFDLLEEKTRKNVVWIMKRH